MQYLARSIFLTLMILAVPVSSAIAQDQPANLTAVSAKVYRGPGGAPLTDPSQTSPRTIVADFLQAQGRSSETASSIRQISSGRPNAAGQIHLRFTQEVGGLAVFGTYAKATVNAQGQLVHLIENLAPIRPGSLPVATVGPRQALNAALAAIHPGRGSNLQQSLEENNTVTFTGDDFFHTGPKVTRVAVAMQNGTLREGYLVETWSEEENLLHHTLISGNGRVLGVQLRTANDSYNIFPDHPNNSTQTVTSGPGAGNTESPQGWLFNSSQESIDITGNNVHAYLDTDNNNSSDPGGTLISDGNFLAVANLMQSPSTTQNRNVAVQNLFYLNNWIHDELYRHGFTEATGNFQENNFVGGGLGSDSVNAEAQDGGGTSNANFATPSDGSNPRMQMYIWTQSSPNRDGDLDSDIVYHEYGHGLTWRMIGNMSGTMSGAIGEGMSDVLAILINENDVVGEYSYNNANGIRSAPYSNYPRTYGDFSGSSVHFNGEIYAATIWRLWQIFQNNAISKNTLSGYLVDGMNFTPAGPAFEDMRDGILAASPVEAHDCLIWEAFAQFGIGVGAKGSAKGGGPFGGGRVTVSESFAVPASCESPPAEQPPVANAGPDQTITDGEQVTLDGTGSFDPDGGIIVSYVWTEGGQQIATGASPTVSLLLGSHTITLEVTDDENETNTDQVAVTVQPAGGGIPPSVAECAPNVGNPNDRLTVQVTGSDFQPGATVNFGERVTIQSVTFLNSSQLNVAIKVHRRAASGSRDVTVTNPDGNSDTLAGCFSVN